MNTNIQLQSVTKTYDDKLNSLSSIFFSALDDYKKYYVYNKKNPSVGEYEQYFLNSKAQLQGINKQVITLSNDIKNDLEEINNIVSLINLQLSNEKELNQELVKLVEKLNNTNNGSSILFNDTSFIYSKQYLYNIELFICIIVLSVIIIYSMRNNSNSNSNTNSVKNETNVKK